MTLKQQYLSETPKILLTNSIILRWKCISYYVAAKLTKIYGLNFKFNISF